MRTIKTFRAVFESASVSSEILSEIDDYGESLTNLECDGMTRVLSYVLKKHNVKHTAKVGSLTIDGEKIPLHFWIVLEDGRIVDGRSTEKFSGELGICRKHGKGKSGSVRDRGVP
jgi:hypothetical protein